MAATKKRPTPGTEKSVSITNEPVTSPAVIGPNTVQTGIMAFLSTCSITIFRFCRPLARAVST